MAYNAICLRSITITITTAKTTIAAVVHATAAAVTATITTITTFIHTATAITDASVCFVYNKLIVCDGSCAHVVFPDFVFAEAALTGVQAADVKH